MQLLWSETALICHPGFPKGVAELPRWLQSQKSPGSRELRFPCAPTLSEPESLSEKQIVKLIPWPSPEDRSPAPGPSALPHGPSTPSLAGPHWGLIRQGPNLPPLAPFPPWHSSWGCHGCEGTEGHPKAVTPQDFLAIQHPGRCAQQIPNGEARNCALKCIHCRAGVSLKAPRPWLGTLPLAWDCPSAPQHCCSGQRDQGRVTAEWSCFCSEREGVSGKHRAYIQQVHQVEKKR